MGNKFDLTALMTMLLSFFNLIPWAAIAAFLTAVYFLFRIYYIVKNKGK